MPLTPKSPYGSRASRLPRSWLSASARIWVLGATLGLSTAIAPPARATETEAPSPPPEPPPEPAQTPLELRFNALEATVTSIDAEAVPCKLGEDAVGCLEAAKAATLDLRLVRKQLAKDIRVLRKAKHKVKLAHALEFGSSLNHVKSDLQKLGAADTASAAQAALAQLQQRLDKAKIQLAALNAS